MGRKCNISFFGADYAVNPYLIGESWKYFNTTHYPLRLDLMAAYKVGKWEAEFLAGLLIKRNNVNITVFSNVNCLIRGYLQSYQNLCDIVDNLEMLCMVYSCELS